MFLEEKLEQAEKLLKEVKAELINKDNYVPDCIKIVGRVGLISMGIKNGQQELHYSKDAKTFGIFSVSTFSTTRCKLVRVINKDREVGKIYFYTNADSLEYSDNLCNYAIYLGEGKDVWRGSSEGINVPEITKIDMKNVYEVVPF